MNAELSSFLHHNQAISNETATWGSGISLSITAYVTAEMPPLQYVTSIRAIVLQGDSVLVVRDAEGTFHILPGGRREEGETIRSTLEREVLEETGWTIHDPSLIGVLHFHHLTPRPLDYAYPYPDFMQLVYWATVDQFDSTKRKQGQYEVESGFRTMDETATLGLPASQRLLLKAALTKRNENQARR